MAGQTFLALPNKLLMPAIGLGTWEAKDEVELEKALNIALENGYRHIDTAWVYENENIIGRVLQKWLTLGKIKREDLFITTKLPMIGVHEDRVEDFLKKSLQNLQLDYVDLYLIHFPVGCKFEEGAVQPSVNENGEVETEPTTDLQAIWQKMELQVDAGRAKAIGVSNFNVEQVSAILKTSRIKPANLQVEIHPFLQQKALVEFCHQNGITVTAYSPLGSPGYNKFLQKMGKEEKSLPNVLGNSVIIDVATKHSKTPAQVALRFLLQRGIGVIPKSVTPERIAENMGIFDFRLDNDDVVALSNLETGENARICDFKVFEGLGKHPSFPFKPATTE